MFLDDEQVPPLCSVGSKSAHERDAPSRRLVAGPSIRIGQRGRALKSFATTAVVLAVLVTAPALLAQWPRYMPAGASKGADGKVDLDAAVPRTADGKPDLSGVWDVIPCIDCPQARGGGGRGAAPAGGGGGRG